MISLKVKETNTYPLIVHGAGKSKNAQIFQTLCKLLSTQQRKDCDNSNLDVTIITWKGGARYKNKDTVLEQCARFYGIPMVILDYPDNKSFWEGTKHAKITLTSELLKSGTIKTKYFMYLDIGDVLLLASPEEILERYKKHFSGKIVFNSERNHYPKDDRLVNLNLSKEFRDKWDKVCEFDFAKTGTNFKYLNSGAAIGETRMLVDFMNYIVDENNCTGYHHVPHLVDTMPIKIAHHDNRDYVVTDDNCELFLCPYNGTIKSQELHIQDVEISYTSD